MFDDLENNEDMCKLVDMMCQEMGRIPTEEEVMIFIYGTNKVREDILHSGSQ